MIKSKEHIVKEVIVSSDCRVKNVVVRRKIPLDVLSALLQLIPAGYVTTYKSLAKVFNIHPRYIGYLIKRNSNPIIVPCHRVIRSDGRLGGYTLNNCSVPEFKKKLLELEGVKIVNDKIPEDFIITRV